MALCLHLKTDQVLKIGPVKIINKNRTGVRLVIEAPRDFQIERQGKENESKKPSGDEPPRR